MLKIKELIMQTAVREKAMPTFVPIRMKNSNIPEQKQELNEDEILEQCFAGVDLRIDPDFKSQPMYTHEEFWDMACKGLGKLYGLDDIRDAQ